MNEGFLTQVLPPQRHPQSMSKPRSRIRTPIHLDFNMTAVSGDDCNLAVSAPQHASVIDIRRAYDHYSIIHYFIQWPCVSSILTSNTRELFTNLSYTCNAHKFGSKQAHHLECPSYVSLGSADVSATALVFFVVWLITDHGN